MGEPARHLTCGVPKTKDWRGSSRHRCAHNILQVSHNCSDGDSLFLDRGTIPPGLLLCTLLLVLLSCMDQRNFTLHTRQSSNEKFHGFKCMHQYLGITEGATWELHGRSYGTKVLSEPS
jgi:hypothetical protein